MCSSLKHCEQARNTRLCLEYLLQDLSTLSPCSVSFTQEGVDRRFGWLEFLTFSYTFNNMPACFAYACIKITCKKFKMYMSVYLGTHFV